MLDASTAVLARPATLPGLITRPGTSADYPCVLSSWLKGYRYGSSYGRAQRNGVFFPDHQAIALDILARPTAQLLVACLEDMPTTIAGFLVHERSTPPVLHWVYVKDSLRRHGVASMLLRAAALPHDLAGVELSHASDDWYGFLKQARPLAVYRHSRQYWPGGEGAPSARTPGGAVDHGRHDRRQGLHAAPDADDSTPSLSAHRGSGG